ncbi:MAG TPA: AMP-binding protein [Burkholderiales bacterium]|nr:AMP-binding protein [Burkholderiales bacterium]
MVSAPLVRGFGAGAAFAYRQGRRIEVARFLADVSRLAALLPERPYLLNLCTDRYHFTVGFAAALVRRQVNLLPPNETPDLIEQLTVRYPGVYCLCDRPTGLATIETMLFPGPADDGDMTLPVPEIPESQVAATVFTSGSTGQPVPYRKSWGSLVRVARAEIEMLGLGALPGMAVVGTVPSQHVFGLEATVLTVMQGGLSLCARRPFYPADVRAELESLPRPRSLVTTPVHLRVLLAEPGDLPPVDFLLCATAPLSPQLAAQAEARFAAPLHEIYGCTESGGIASRRTVATGEWSAMTGVRLRTDGERTWVKGGHVEVEVALADVIELRRQGKFLLHGRTADLVNIAGKRTSLAHLNYHLNSVEGVLDGTFVLPEQEGATVTRLTAYVVAPGLTRETLMGALRQRIDAAFLPRPLHFVDALPRNEVGKLPRQSLDEFAAGFAARMAG